MKRLFIKLLVFALLFIAIDQAIGAGFSTLIAKARGGDTGKNNEIADRTTASVILFGSSRCDHHYDPRIIADSLGMTCYNAGRDGNGILLMYPYYRMLSSRYQPRLVIYDLSGFDVAEDDHTKYLEWLRQFYGRAFVDSMVWDINPDERYKMLCRSYRFNGKGLQLIGDAIHPMQQDILGYKPLYGTIPYEPTPIPAEGQKPIDPFKEKYLIRLIQDCKRNGTRLIFTFSPSYGQTWHSPYHDALRRLFRRYHVPFLYHQNDKRFVMNRRYFKDSSHLNHVGAEAYTRMVASEIKNASSGSFANNMPAAQRGTDADNARAE